MATTVFKTISLKGESIRKERIANAAITPGHLVEVMSTGKLRVHATIGGDAQKAFAVEDDLQGKNIATAYSANAIAQYEVFQRGAEVYALLADGENVAIGDPLMSGGDGTLKKYTAPTGDLWNDSSTDVSKLYVNAIVGYAVTAVNMAGSTDADPSPRIVVEIA